MRVNVYAEEVRAETKVVRKGKFLGLRIYLASAQELHNTLEDDDRSAITIWGVKACSKLVKALECSMSDMNCGIVDEEV